MVVPGVNASARTSRFVKPVLKGDHVVPPFLLMKMPLPTVPANTVVGVVEFMATALTFVVGSPLLTANQVLPPSRLL